MSLPTTFVLGQAAAAPQGNPLVTFLPLILLFVVFYFLMIRPQMKKQKEQRAMLSALSKGDEVVTTGGIAGRIDEVSDAFITLEIAPSVKVKLQKGAVSQVLPKGTLKSA
jgi:preprotein translocase subunit YajC